MSNQLIQNRRRWAQKSQTHEMKWIQRKSKIHNQDSYYYKREYCNHKITDGISDATKGPGHVFGKNDDRSNKVRMSNITPKYVKNAENAQNYG